jgi:hypothetical protein
MGTNVQSPQTKGFLYTTSYTLLHMVWAPLSNHLNRGDFHTTSYASLDIKDPMAPIPYIEARVTTEKKVKYAGYPEVGIY